MVKHKPHRKGEATPPPLTYKEGPTSDGRTHLHYELSPMVKQKTTVGTFNSHTANRINSDQKRKMKRGFA